MPKTNDPRLQINLNNGCTISQAMVDNLKYLTTCTVHPALRAYNNVMITMIATSVSLTMCALVSPIKVRTTDN